MSAPTPKKITPAAEAPAKNFEEAFAALESIVAQMESGQMPLEASLEAYKRGNAMLEYCQKSLAEVDQQVRILTKHQQLVQFNANTASSDDQ